MSNNLAWVSVNDALPDINETVWLHNANTGWVALGCRVFVDCRDSLEVCYLWAVSNGIIYAENGKIVSECELDDDYDVTHWSRLPELLHKPKTND